MPYDGLVTRKIKEELEEKLIYAKVDKIIQPTKDELVLYFRAQKETLRLLLSANAETARTHLTKYSLYKNPAKPFNFCMILRKYLSGAKLLHISQPSNDRILRFSFENSNELGDKENRTLVIEMMGKYSNIILLNTSDTIIDSLKHVDFETSRVREVMPGRKYVLPLNTGKHDPFTITEKDYNTLLAEQKENFLANTFIGICTPAAKYFAQNTDSSYSAFSKFIHQETQAMLFSKNEQPHDFYFCNCNLPETTAQSVNSLSEAIDEVYRFKITKKQLLSAKNNLAENVSHLITKTKKKLDIISTKLESTKEMEDLKIKGELLSANLYQIKPYSTEVKVYDYYNSNSELNIALDPNLSPSQNVQKIFKKYNKMKNTVAACSEQQEQLTNDLAYYESLLFEIQNQESIEDLEEIKEELIAQKLIHAQKTEKKTIQKNYLTYTYNNFEILVGKNNLQNDKLTFKIAHKNDLWFHVKNAPGSHTILRTNSQVVSRETLEFAASLAAAHSKLKNSPKVEVDYTEVKNVKKIPGAKPGMVIYVNYKTIYIEPNAHSSSSQE